MNKINKQGFTILELMVVISIIGLLASVVLTAMQSARVKADDAQRNAIVGEYVKALALAYDKAGTGQYPVTGNNTTIYCLGDYAPTGTGNYGTASACRYGLAINLLSENSTVNTAVVEFLASLPTLKLVTTSTTYAYQGPFYQCTSATGCSTAQIEWYLQQSNAKCIKGAGFSPTGSGTKCILTLN